MPQKLSKLSKMKVILKIAVKKETKKEKLSAAVKLQKQRDRKRRK